MSTVRESKINQLLRSMPSDVVMLTSWLKHVGYSNDLLKRYRKSGWLKSIGTGALIRSGDDVDYLGALYALQQQGGLHIHIGGRSALSLLGKSHYLELSPVKTILFGAKGDNLPLWFKKYDWQTTIEYHSTSMLPPGKGLVDMQVKKFTVKISGEARALMECLYLTPKHQELSECYELMEGMNNLHPQTVQDLLVHCSSLKVKRLFLCLAEKMQHEWFKQIDVEKIYLGKGKRSIVSNGVYDAKYRITIPPNWKKSHE